MYPAFEIPVAGQNTAAYQVVLLNSFHYGFRKRTTISDASHTSILIKSIVTRWLFYKKPIKYLTPTILNPSFSKAGITPDSFK
jgi:hypothetical protein